MCTYRIILIYYFEWKDRYCWGFNKVQGISKLVGYSNKGWEISTIVKNGSWVLLRYKNVSVFESFLPFYGKLRKEIRTFKK